MFPWPIKRCRIARNTISDAAKNDLSDQLTVPSPLRLRSSNTSSANALQSLSTITAVRSHTCAKVISSGTNDSIGVFLAASTAAARAGRSCAGTWYTYGLQRVRGLQPLGRTHAIDHSRVEISHSPLLGMPRGPIVRVILVPSQEGVDELRRDRYQRQNRLQSIGSRYTATRHSLVCPYRAHPMDSD